MTSDHRPVELILKNTYLLKQFGVSMSDSHGEKTDDQNTELRQRFNQINDIELSTDQHPKISLSVLSDEKAMQHFLEAADWCVGQIKQFHAKSRN